MTNEELIKALRCKSNDINDCTMCAYHNACYGGTLGEIAAAALEAAERLLDQNTQRCEALRKQLREAHENYEKHLNELTTKCNQLQAAVDNYEKRIAELMPKEGEWIDEQRGRWIYAKCNLCGKVQDVRSNYCPNCGAKTKTVTDCHTLEESER